MAIKIFAQIEVSIDERFSRVDNVSITLDDEALSQIANAIAAQQSFAPDPPSACEDCGSVDPQKHYTNCPLAKSAGR